MSNNEYTEDAALAAELYEAETPGREWWNAPTDIKREYLIRACQTNDLQRKRDRMEADLRVKQTAVDAYRASIAGTVPAHRLDTRQNGFLDGWDAALAWVAQQRNAEEGK